ncbi:hypothetical protein [Halostagnicola kamekurae]|uniref:Uncharacterized protein n=1 Tax=Halostagnicola kamekurae TaxID=619731 RepID=A0A1I6SES2_9EURY|nr:hypothetical protein [Halostagnicola kamekurae]SFS75486.1 hypothetical protein SAMN04488556_2619 [Halostagnicola kamekurae]
MSRQPSVTKTLGVCTACGAYHAVRKFEDGSVYAIGSPQGCHCGASEFTIPDA